MHLRLAAVCRQPTRELRRSSGCTYLTAAELAWLEAHPEYRETKWSLDSLEAAIRHLATGGMGRPPGKPSVLTAEVRRRLSRWFGEGRKTTVADMAKQLGISRQSIYNWLKTRQEG